MPDATPHFEGEFDIAPVPKGRPRVANGHAFTPSATRRFEADFGMLVRVRMNRNRIRRLSGPVALEVRYRPRVGLRGDIDNFLKAILDACNGVLFEDDSQVVRVYAWRLPDGAPRISVKAWAATDEGTFWDKVSAEQGGTE